MSMLMNWRPLAYDGVVTSETLTSIYGYARVEHLPSIARSSAASFIDRTCAQVSELRQRTRAGINIVVVSLYSSSVVEKMTELIPS